MIEDNYEERLLVAGQVIELLSHAAKEGTSLSLTRFSHAEISILETSFTYPEWVKNWEYSVYQGATAAPDQLQAMLIEALQNTDIAGLHLSTAPDEVDRNFAVGTKQLLNRLGIKPRAACSPWMPHELSQMPQFWNWLKQYPVVLVGRRSNEAANIFSQYGIKIVATLNLEGCEGIADAHRQLCSNFDWQIALVSAGVPATILVPQLSRESGRIAIDFGHAMDMVIEGANFDFYRIAKEWNERHLKEEGR